MFEFLIFGGFWFWFLSVVCFCAIVGFIEFNSFFGATATFIVCGVLLYFGGNSQIFKDFFMYVKLNPISILLYMMVYILAGVIWSFIKYYFHLKNFRDRYEDAKKEYIDRYKGKSEIEWKEYADSSYDFQKSRQKPNMDKIMIWMTWWIPSMIWTVINDPIRKFFRWIYYRVIGVYEGMYRRILGDL